MSHVDSLFAHLRRRIPALWPLLGLPWLHPNQQLGGLTHRAETAEAAQREAAALLRGLRGALVTTLDALTGEGGGEDRQAELRERFQQLLDDE